MFAAPRCRSIALPIRVTIIGGAWSITAADGLFRGAAAILHNREEALVKVIPLPDDPEAYAALRRRITTFREELYGLF